MDPWHQADPRLCDSSKDREASSNSFQDNFSPSLTFQKLPDSEEYLEGLEKKLALLKGGNPAGSRGPRSERDRLLKGLSEAREAVVGSLLNSDAPALETGVTEVERSIETNLVLRRIAPQQAVTPSERLRLVREDILAQEQQNVGGSSSEQGHHRGEVLRDDHGGQQGLREGPGSRDG